jgi:phosphatidylinositol-3-phosphatase
MTRTCPLGALVAVALVLSGCGGVPKRLPVQSHTSPKAVLRGAGQPHVAVIVMESRGYGQVLGGRQAPYISALARTYALATNMYAISHPSLPNYLALTGGSTFGIGSDCTSCSVHATGLIDQLSRAGISWKSYMEDMPSSCYTGARAGRYVKKHNPFVYYRDIVSNPYRCANVVPFTQLSTDMAAHPHGTLPSFIWITPNLCHDMHDCSVAAGDRFLAGLVPSLLAALGPRGLLFLTWDEDNGNSAGCCRLASGGRVVTVLAGGGARRGATLSTPTDHYSVLQTIEDLFGLPRLRGAACACTPSLQPLLTR